MEEPMTPDDITELADRLEHLLGLIDRGELTATATMRYRIEGAITALRVVQGDTEALARLLGDDG